MEADAADTLSVLVATDNHLGFLERDPIRGQDSFAAFGEILQLAEEYGVDMVLLGGDLFHENRPSRKSLHQTLGLLRRHCMGGRAVGLEYLSDPAVDFGEQFPTVNYEDPNLNISLPVFSIHGNHDDPSGDGNLSALDVLGASGLINYFGRQGEVDSIRVSPVLLRKGRTHLALYGLGNVRDERLHRTITRKHMVMCQPAEDTGKWFNLMVLHQNRVAHGPKNHIPEHFLGSFLDLVVWGHEHQCMVEPEYNHQTTFYVSQPGSSVATALSSGEAVAKHAAVLRINRRNFRLEKVRLKNVRPFVIEDVVLSAVATLSAQSSEGEIIEYLRQRVEAMIARAQREYQAQLEEGHPQVKAALGPSPKPLVRVRVEYSGGFESFHPQRFGLLFADRVANPRDIVYFYRKARGASQGSSQRTAAATQESRGSVPAPVEAVHVESLISEFLDDASMRMLVDLELAEAIRLFVQKGDNDAIAQSLKATVADTQRRILAEAAAVREATLDAQIADARLVRRRAAEASGHGAAVRARDDRVVAVAVAVAGKRSAMSQADRNAIKAFEQLAAASNGDNGGDDDDNDENDDDDDDSELRAAGEDLSHPAKRGRATKAAARAAAPAKRSRPPPPPPPATKGRADVVIESDRSDSEPGAESDDRSSVGSDFVDPPPPPPPPPALSRPSRNARSTLASSSRASSSVSAAADSDGSERSVAETPVARRTRVVASPEAEEEEEEEASIPSSVARPRGGARASRARGRGRGRGRGAAPARTQRLAFSQRSSSGSSQMPVAVRISDDDDDDDDDGGDKGGAGFGRFSLRKH
ncbi:meiotic recombination [Coemansia javaensis]|uniref:Meiotic recombination n=1 Tax=Coemansia javaensis TaxID=2761396 RepID=A0A9W8HCA0_9FUNG|nr:meiotic recombination [Coemansia javaensis]